MKLEVLLSVMNLKKEDLDKMNLTSKCTVINQCGKSGFEKYKNFNIYSYNEKGLSRSRNRGLENATEDIILICDDDVIYDENYEKNIITEFENNPQADLIFFNMQSPYRKKKTIKKRKRLHIYNSLHYASCFRIIFILQFLLRHREFWKDFGFIKAYKAMLKGSNDYIINGNGYIEI